MLVKTLGLSKLVYAASILCVPEMVIKTVQEKKFCGKTERSVTCTFKLYQSLSSGGTEVSKLSHDG